MTKLAGGQGAVREICDILVQLRSQAGNTLTSEETQRVCHQNNKAACNLLWQYSASHSLSVLSYREKVNSSYESKDKLPCYYSSFAPPGQEHLPFIEKMAESVLLGKNCCILFGSENLIAKKIKVVWFI